MFLQKLQVNNFKNLSDREFDFNRINLIDGENGKGKSSIIEAIIGLFTDDWPSKFENLIQWGQKGFSIKGLFSLYEKNFDYTIEYDKASKRELYINNDFFSGSDAVKELRQYINPDIALYSNISIQGESTQILKEKPTARLEKFKQFFNIKEIDEKIEKIKEDLSTIKDEIKENEIKVEHLKAQKFTYQDVPEKLDYSSLESQVKDIEIEKLKYEQEIEKYKAYKIKLDEYNNYISTKNKSENSIQKLEEQIKDIEKKKPEDEIENIEKKIQEFKEKKINLENKLKQFENDSKKLEKLNIDLKNYQNESSFIILKRVKQLEFNDGDLRYTEEQFRDSFNELTILKNKYEAIQNGKCPTCGAEYTSDNIEEIKNEINLKEISTKEWNGDLKEKKEQKKNYERINQENEIAKNKIDSIERLIENVSNQINEINIENIDKDQTENTLQVLSDSIKEGNEIIAEIKKNNKLKEEIEREIIKFQTTLENLKVIEQPIEIKEPDVFNYRELENLQKQLNIAQEREKEIERIEEFNAKVKEQEKENLKQITKTEDELSNKRRKITLLESSKKILGKDFTSYLIDKGTNYVNNKTNEIFQKSYGKYSASLQKDSSGINFYYTGEKGILSPVVMASGYEKQSLGISFRFALASLHQLGIFVLDEIDSDSDEENSLRLYKTIMNQKWEQLFIVTHRENTKEYLLNLPDCKIFEI